ncbi:MAG: proline/glycine betaine ABC transporter permease [Bacteroidales bacterium]|jgi:glycine betaine/proline transport system permease protein|nr:proline/glycine betaine ABC transporter permease [Bacteroidales bacterium]
MIELNIGEYIEKGIEWLADVGSGFFDAVTVGVDWVVTSFQSLLIAPHPIVIMILFSLLSYFLTARSDGLFTKEGFKSARGLTFFTFVGLFLLYLMGYWEETMNTFALVIASTVIALVIGIPLGIYTARNKTAEKIVRPILDFMQTMPAFVYLIPAILFFSVGNVPGVVATVIFSLPPAVRLTDLGIRGVQPEVVEAAISFGATKKQLLGKVQIPLAMPTILAGVNQVIMLALSMVVIASMVGAEGLGQAVYKGILTADIGLGFEAGLGIVIIAIILDRMTQALGKTK